MTINFGEEFDVFTIIRFFIRNKRIFAISGFLFACCACIYGIKLFYDRPINLVVPIKVAASFGVDKLVSINLSDVNNLFSNFPSDIKSDLYHGINIEGPESMFIETYQDSYVLHLFLNKNVQPDQIFVQKVIKSFNILINQKNSTIFNFKDSTGKLITDLKTIKSEIHLVGIRSLKAKIDLLNFILSQESKLSKYDQNKLLELMYPRERFEEILSRLLLLKKITPTDLDVYLDEFIILNKKLNYMNLKRYQVIKDLETSFIPNFESNGAFSISRHRVHLYFQKLILSVLGAFFLGGIIGLFLSLLKEFFQSNKEKFKLD